MYYATPSSALKCYVSIDSPCETFKGYSGGCIKVSCSMPTHPCIPILMRMFITMNNAQSYDAKNLCIFRSARDCMLLHAVKRSCLCPCLNLGTCGATIFELRALKIQKHDNAKFGKQCLTGRWFAHGSGYADQITCAGCGRNCRMQHGDVQGMQICLQARSPRSAKPAVMSTCIHY